jgi:hypothetical protein
VAVGSLSRQSLGLRAWWGMDGLMCEWERAIANVELQVARLALPPPGPRSVPTPVSTMAFDTVQELFWAGNDYVCRLSFKSPSGENGNGNRKMKAKERKEMEREGIKKGI